MLMFNTTKNKKSSIICINENNTCNILFDSIVSFYAYGEKAKCLLQESKLKKESDNFYFMNNECKDWNKIKKIIDIMLTNDGAIEFYCITNNKHGWIYVDNYDSLKEYLNSKERFEYINS